MDGHSLAAVALARDDRAEALHYMARRIRFFDRLRELGRQRETAGEPVKLGSRFFPDRVADTQCRHQVEGECSYCRECSENFA